MIITKNMTDAPHCDNKDLWGTPQPIFDKLDMEFGFDTDPCCTRQTAKCNEFWTPAENGLLQNWDGRRLFVNPPYSRGNIDKWVAKCFYSSPGALEIVALLPVSTSSDWWHKYCLKQTKYWVNKRIKFVGAQWTAPFSSVIIRFNNIDQSLQFNQ